MSYKQFREIKRNKTKEINVGDVKIGGDNPISVQSMTNTLTTDVKDTIKQINDCAEEGAELIRGEEFAIDNPNGTTSDGKPWYITDKVAANTTPTEAASVNIGKITDYINLGSS